MKLKDCLNLIFKVILCLCVTNETWAIESISLTQESKLITPEVYIYNSTADTASASTIWKQKEYFERNNNPTIPGYLFNENTSIWVRIQLKNPEYQREFRILIENSNLDLIEEYRIVEDEPIWVSTQGQIFPFEFRKIDNPEFIYNLEVAQKEMVTLLFKLKNNESQSIPIWIGSKDSISAKTNKKSLFYGFFGGIFLVMFLYNTILYFSTKYKIYAFYSVYVFFIGLGLFTWTGYSFKFIWPNATWFSQRAFIFFLSLVAISAVLFTQKYLNTKKKSPSFHKGLNVFMMAYIIVIFVNIFSIPIAQILVNVLGVSVLYILVYAIYLSYKGSSEARIYLVAWSFYLLGVLVYFFREFNFIPHNHFSFHMVHYGSAVEVVLLSLALANRINILKREKRQITEHQNALLEEKVEERTNELELALQDLRLTQSQLVEAEKMASLGQLTAGVAHEINNPINFISSNIKPLELDLKDIYSIILEIEKTAGSNPTNLSAEIKEIKEKYNFQFTVEEIEALINGIKQGAERTTEIVHGLKTFSSLNQSDFKIGNIHHGLEATLMILKSKTKGIILNKIYGDLKDINTLHGQLNQVFMNILDNAIYACSQKAYAENENPEIKIKTLQDEEITSVIISDNGVGMSKQIMDRIYEPFFTNKPVGSGSGLGMSIVHGILQKINADLKIHSQEGFGTELVINLKNKAKL